MPLLDIHSHLHCRHSHGTIITTSKTSQTLAQLSFEHPYDRERGTIPMLPYS